MTKDNESQDKRNKGGARRRPGGKNYISTFQWGSVDDQAQEDLIVPTSVPSKRRSAKASRRRDKDVGTMYVSTSEDIYAPPKKRVREEPHLEDFASFVAEIEDDEEDGFATPSYGRTKLTRNDEELVEELATQKEKPAPKPRRAPKPRPVEGEAESEARPEGGDSDEREERRERGREKREKTEKIDKAEKKERREKADKSDKNERRERRDDDKRERRCKREERDDAAAESVVETSVRESESVEAVAPVERDAADVRAKRERAPKRSFLSKIKEAISTGSIASEKRDEVASDAEERLSNQEMRRLTARVASALETSVEELAAKRSGDRSQVETLSAMIDALIDAAIATKARTAAQAEELAASRGKWARETTVREPRDAKVESVDLRSPVEQIFERADAPTNEKFAAPEPVEASAATETVEPKAENAVAPSSERSERKDRRRERRERVERKPLVEKAALETPVEAVEKAESVERKAPERRAVVPDWESADDDFDPIALWENLPDDESENAEKPESAAAPKERFARRREDERAARTPDDFDDAFDEWDEGAAKKKSGRARQSAEDEPILEAAPSKLTAEVGETAENRETARTAESLSDDERSIDRDANAADSARGSKKSARPKKSRKSTAEAGSESADSSEKTEKSGVEKGSAKPLDHFGELKLTKKTLKALQQMGYSEPTPIQSGTIPRIQAGVDLMGQARTGTGKTAAFMIPIVEGVDECEPPENGAPLAMAVVPTRELAVQVRDETQRLAQYRDLNVVACYGGKPIASQVEKIRRGVDILVGTPGRIIDLNNRGALDLSKLRWVVLDEADRMLDIGFRPDVEKILRKTPNSRQTLLFSATLAPPVVRLAQAYMKDPEKYDFSQKDVAADTIEQFYLTVDQSRKFDALVKLLELQQPRQAIVFCRTKRCVDTIGRRLQSRFPGVSAIHGDLPQTKRDHIMSDFRAEKTKILVATDVVGRGIDVSSVSHIVNYDIPQSCDDYVHRVGRAGRMGREGVAFTLVTAAEGAELTRVEIRINRLLERMELPGFEAYSKPVEGPDSAPEPERFVRKPVFGQSTRRVRRAL